MRLEESYHERFGEEFGIDGPTQATEREGYFKGNRFVSADRHSAALRYSFNVIVFDGPPRVEYGVSPDGNERIEGIIDDHRGEIGEAHAFGGTNWLRVRGDQRLQPILSDGALETVAPEISETVSRVLWTDERFQSTWSLFCELVDKWHRIIDAKLDE